MNVSKITKRLFAVLFFALIAFQSYSQDMKYEPKGNPDNWTFSITPFVLLPNISGDIQSKFLSEEFGIGPADFIESLKGTFMISAEVSKGKFFATPSYIYTQNEVEKIIWDAENLDASIVVTPNLKKNIVELITGMRLRLSEKIILDPFVGFRYTGYNLSGDIQGVINTTSFDENIDLWDPIIGIRAHYYPIPRVPIELKADIGGFGVGSDITWSTFLHSGYSISPCIDLLAGFAVLGIDYSDETKNGRDFGMNSVTYGIDLGVRFYIPKRYKDPELFKNNKQ